jgi:Ca-activated chloride channel homolog
LQGRDASVHLVRFHHRLEIAQHFAIKAGDSSALLAAMQSTSFDGGTNLAALQIDRATDLAIILSDGDSSFEPYQSAASKNLAKQTVVVAATATPSPVGLRTLADRFAAKVITLAGKIDFDAATRDALRPQLSLLASSSDCVGDAAITWPASDQARIAWRCPLGAAIALQWRLADQSKSQTMAMPAALTVSAESAAALRRAWAKVRLEQLQSKANAKAEQLSLALQYELVTEQTSLLVLDSVDDYLRYNIAPKEAALRAEFDARRAEMDDDPEAGLASLAERIDALRAQWKALSDWHQRAHPWLEAVLGDYAEQNQDIAGMLDSRAQSIARKQLATVGALLDDKASATRDQKMQQVFLAMQQQREQWLAKLPEADRARIEDNQSHAQNRSLRRRAEVAGEPPPPSPTVSQSMPASAAEPVADMEATEELSDIVVTGSNFKAIDDSEEKIVIGNTQASITLKPYDANAPYLARIKTAKDAYQQYLLEAQTDSSVGFYLDCAEYFQRDLKQADVALRILSNIAELQIEDIGATRVLAETLRQWQRWDFALQQFSVAKASRMEEPQGYRDLALSLAAAPIDQGGNLVLAVELLWQVASHDWDQRFNGITLASLHELNDIYMRLSNSEKSRLKPLEIPADLLNAVPVGLRVVLGWNANDVDIDLWVRDPAGEWAYYSQPQTRTGGQMSDDFTAGYGPETFSIARPLPGKYTVFAHYFANNTQKLLAPVSVYLEFQTPFNGNKPSRKAAIVRRLEANKEQIEIGEFVVE